MDNEDSISGSLVSMDWEKDKPKNRKNNRKNNSKNNSRSNSIRNITNINSNTNLSSNRNSIRNIKRNQSRKVSIPNNIVKRVKKVVFLRKRTLIEQKNYSINDNYINDDDIDTNHMNHIKNKSTTTTKVKRSNTNTQNILSNNKNTSNIMNSNNPFIMDDFEDKIFNIQTLILEKNNMKSQPDNLTEKLKVRFQNICGIFNKELEDKLNKNSNTQNNTNTTTNNNSGIFSNIEHPYFLKIIPVSKITHKTAVFNNVSDIENTQSSIKSNINIDMNTYSNPINKPNKYKVYRKRIKKNNNNQSNNTSKYIFIVSFWEETNTYNISVYTEKTTNTTNTNTNTNNITEFTFSALHRQTKDEITRKIDVSELYPLREYISKDLFLMSYRFLISLLYIENNNICIKVNELADLLNNSKDDNNYSNNNLHMVTSSNNTNTNNIINKSNNHSNNQYQQHLPNNIDIKEFVKILDMSPIQLKKTELNILNKNSKVLNNKENKGSNISIDKYVGGSSIEKNKEKSLLRNIPNKMNNKEALKNNIDIDIVKEKDKELSSFELIQNISTQTINTESIENYDFDDYLDINIFI